MITVERLKELLDYQENTGSFVRKIKRRSYKAGTVAGFIDREGYRIITIDDRIYRAHRLVWLYVYGCIPDLEIDHIDRDKDNNRISNLRLATRLQNAHNMHAPSVNNKAGSRGVCERKGRWRVFISIDGKQKEFPSCSSREEATERYVELKKIHQSFAFPA